ncbi:PhzF family phenazine biosynthesis protein [Nocardioides daejeonensis]|uniref:PhzF family phenazine biosynthesis protein n=1 Tax=Nocardioides daejeonensis TaxID=1046556 RepID=UPI000D745C5B|nr:PhzF family phenazine biosynthesis protein [Nocardioides daejeonensis]
MRSYDFSQVDVFAPGPLTGNPVAVVHDAEGLDDAEMAAFARWTNLSETTFLLPPRDPAADYRLRIFTPGGELPFAGHPTLGSAHAWLALGGAVAGDALVQECGIGNVTLRRTGDRLAFQAPDFLREGPVEDRDRARAIASLGLPEEAAVDAWWLDNGPGWLGLRLRSADDVLAIRPDPALMGDLKIGVIGPHAPGGPADFEVRAFASSIGVDEDPVTGSLNAGFARWLIRSGVAPASYVARQGTALGRDGRVHIDTDADGEQWVGGECRTLISGSLAL